MVKLKLACHYLKQLVQVTVCGLQQETQLEPHFQHVLLLQKRQNAQLLNTNQDQFVNTKMENVEAIVVSMTE